MVFVDYSTSNRGIVCNCCHFPALLVAQGNLHNCWITVGDVRIFAVTGDDDIAQIGKEWFV